MCFALIIGLSACGKDSTPQTSTPVTSTNTGTSLGTTLNVIPTSS